MKKWMAVLLTMFLLATTLCAGAQEIVPQETASAPIVLSHAYGDRTPEQAYEELIVGVTTRPNGCFFTDMWGNNTTDIDVRSLIHGYNLMAWQSAMGTFAMNPTVVAGIGSTLDEAGNKTHLVTLATDLTYNDGKPITAADYVFSILLESAPQMKEIGATVAKDYYIEGARQYALGESQAISGVRLLGEYQFSVTIRAEYLPFFFELALLDFVPYPIQTIAPGCEVADDGQGAYIRNIDQTLTEPLFTAQLLRQTILDPKTGYQSHPAVSSGPYALTEYDAETGSASFSMNPYYKGDENGQQPSIALLGLKTVARDDMLSLLENGEVDLLHKVVAAETIDGGLAIAGQGLIRTSNYPRTGLSLISFNCEQGPAQFEKVRQAVALCFDRDAFIQDYVGNYGMAVDGYYGIGQWMVQLVNGTLAAPMEMPAEGAPQEEVDAYNEKAAQWAALSLESLNPYTLDVEGAKRLLVEDGWTLNEAGEPFDEGRDAVRCKDVNGELMKLSMTMVVPEGNTAAVAMDQMLSEHLAQVGGQLSIEEMPFDKLLQQYYRQQARDCDMFYLATNFVAVFDPSGTYSLEEAAQGALNTTGLLDETLEKLAVDMRMTEQGDVLSYCQKWLAFQRYWNQTLPAVPVYSNIYFDFYVDRLQDYQISAHETWPSAILYAYLSDAMEEKETPETDIPEEEGGFVIIP